MVGITYTGHDMASARPREHLNDTILEIGMRLELLPLVEMGFHTDVHLLNSWILARLSENVNSTSRLLKNASYGRDFDPSIWNEASRAYNLCGHGRSDKETVDIFSKEFLLFPVHGDHHWSMVFVHFVHVDNEAPAATIFLSDSLAGPHEPSYIASLVRFFLNFAWHSMKAQKVGRTPSVQSRMLMHYSNENCPEIILQTPRQNDGYNCGVHSIFAVGCFVECYSVNEGKAGSMEISLEEAFKLWNLEYGAADRYRSKLLQRLEELLGIEERTVTSERSHVQPQSTIVNDSKASSRLNELSTTWVSNKRITNRTMAQGKSSTIDPIADGQENRDDLSTVDILLSLNPARITPSRAPSRDEEQDDTLSSSSINSSQSDTEPDHLKIGFKSVRSLMLTMRFEEPTHENAPSDLHWLPRELSKSIYPPSLEPSTDKTESEVFYILRESLWSFPAESFGDCIFTLLRDYFAWFVRLGQKNARSISVMIAKHLESRVLHSGREYSVITKNGSKFRPEFGFFPILLGCVCREYPKKKPLGGKNQRARRSAKCGCRVKVKIGFGLFEVSRVEHSCPRHPFGDRGHASNRNLFRTYRMSQESEEAIYSTLNQCVRTNGNDFKILKNTILQHFPGATDEQISQLVSSTRARYQYRKSPEVLHGLLATEIEKIDGHILYEPSPDKRTNCSPPHSGCIPNGQIHQRSTCSSLTVHLK